MRAENCLLGLAMLLFGVAGWLVLTSPASAVATDYENYNDHL